MMSLQISWEDLWQATAYAGVIILSSITLVALTASHRPEGYYLDAGADGTTCVWSSIQWEPDSKVYCSSDVSKTLTVLMALQPQKEVKDPGVVVQ